MCAPIPHAVHLRLNNLHNNLHSRVFSARRVLDLESRQTIVLPPIPQYIPQNTAPQVEPSLTLTNLPVTTLPPTALSPSESVLSLGSSSQGIETPSMAPFVSTIYITSSAYVPSSPLSVTTLTSAFTLNPASSMTVVSTVPLSSGSATISSIDASVLTLSASSTYDATSGLVSTGTFTSVTTIASIVSQSSDSTVTTTSYSSIQSTETDTVSESFIPAPSPTMTTLVDPSSSIIISSTINGNTSAVNTSTASPIAAKPASLSTHNPPLYIGIVLGTIAAIACLCALIAWFIRFRGNARRRRAARSLKLPWAKSDDGDTWGLESGHGPGSDTDLAALGVMNLGSREDLAHVQAWSPRGDRDVGEPRRTDSYMQGSTYSLQNHPIPEHCLFSDDSVRAFASSEGYSTASLLPHHNLRQLPSHLIDQELVARVSREHASLRSNDNIDPLDFPSRDRDCGTPRETMNKPRFLSLRGGGLNVPWCPNSDNSPRSMVERLRNHRKPLPTEPPWQLISPRQNSSEINAAEPWSTSFRTSLVSAFNAVAANLSSAAGAPRMNDEFTPVPPKRTARKSVRDTFWDDNMAKAKEPSRETSVSTVTSKAWTLEETRDGAGVVRLFIPGLQGCGDETSIQRPHLSGPTLSFGDGHDIFSDDDGGRQRIVERPQVPLAAPEKPPPAVTHPEPYHVRRNTRKVVNSSLSRAGSIYSTASTHIGVQTRNILASETNSIVIAPSQISRLSSSDSSLTSNIFDGSTGEIEEGLNAASQALKERRTRVH